MSDRLTSWLRTVVPAAWSSVVAWLVSRGLPAWLTDALAGLNEFVVLVVLGAAFALLRWVEPKMPDWLTRLLMGSARPPTYDKNQAPAA